MIGNEILDQFNNSAENLVREAPIRILESLFLLAIGLGLFWLKPIFKSGIKSWTDVATRKNVQAIFLILENLNQLILPVAGYFAICNGLKGMNIFGIYSELFFDFALRIVLSIVIARWLILSIASPTIQIGHLLNFPKEKEKNIINVVIQLAVGFSTILFVDMIHKGFNLTQNSLVNLSFPIVLLNAFTLFKLSKAIRNAENYPTLVEKSAFFSKVISRLFLAIIILIPIITMFGYLEAALYFLKGIILSLAVIGGTYVAFHILDTFIKGAFSFLKDEMMMHIDEPCDHGFIISVFDKELLKMFTPNTEDHEIWYKKVKDEVDTNYFFSSCNTNLENKIYVIKHQPTAERLAQHWYKRLFDPIKTRSEGNAILYKIRVWETPNCFADFVNPNA